MQSLVDWGLCQCQLQIEAAEKRVKDDLTDKGELPLRAGHGFKAPISILLVRLSSSFNMLVQMCASFS